MLDKNSRILHIDDDSYWRSVVANYLLTLAYDNITSVAELDEVLSLKEHNLIITDLNLYRTPGLDDIMLLRFSEQTKHIPIIIATASGDLTSRNEAFCLGIVGWLVKPFTIEQLKKLLDYLSSPDYHSDL